MYVINMKKGAKISLIGCIILELLLFYSLINSIIKELQIYDKIVEKYGKEELKKVAKLNFKNFKDLA